MQTNENQQNPILPKDDSLPGFIVGGLAILTACVSFIILITGSWLSAGPFLYASVTAILLYPFRSVSAVKSIYIALIFVLVIYIIRELQTVLVPFVVSFMVAYIVAPLMGYFRKFKIPSTISAMIVTAIFVGSVVFMVFLFGPLLSNQIQSLYKQLNFLFNYIPNMINEPEVRSILLNLGIDPYQVKSQITSNLFPEIKSFIISHLGVLNNVVTALSWILNIVVSLILIPFLLFYFLKDYEELLLKFKGFIPDDRREFFKFHSIKLQQIIATYVRGQLLIALIGGVIAFIPFILFGVPYAFMLGVFYIFLSLIPYVGVIITIVIGILVSSTSGDFMGNAVLITSVLLIVAGIQNFILAPKILGDQVGLHPVVLILSISVFGYFLGILGMLLAIPITAAINVYFRDWLDNRNQHFALRKMNQI